MFPKEFPQAALLEIIKMDKQLLPLAIYDLAGYGLYLYFGDLKYPVTADFETISALAGGAEAAQKILARATELRASGKGWFLTVLQLLAEFGPVIIQLIQVIKSLVNKG